MLCPLPQHGHKSSHAGSLNTNSILGRLPDADLHVVLFLHSHRADDSQLIIIGLGGSLGKNAVLLLWTLHAWNYTSFKVYHGKISFSPFYVPVLCSRCPDRWQVGGQAWDTDQQPPWWPFHCPLVTMVTCSHSNSIFIGSPWLLRSIAALPSSSCCGSHES